MKYPVVIVEHTIYSKNYNEITVKEIPEQVRYFTAKYQKHGGCYIEVTTKNYHTYVLGDDAGGKKAIRIEFMSDDE